MSDSPPGAESGPIRESVLECGSSSSSGVQQPQRYDPQQMQALLRSDEVLRTAYGGSTVTTCDDARRFMVVFEQQADRLAKAAPGAGASEPDPASLPVEKGDKVINGLPSTLAPVAWWANNANTASFCSGVIISARNVLTSAHCIPSNGWMLVTIRRQRVKTAAPEPFFPTAVWMYWTKHPYYVANNDPSWDVAVGSLWTGSFPGDAMIRVWLGNASASQDIYYWGFGLTKTNSLPPNYQTQGAGRLRTVSTYWFDSVPSTNPPQATCLGDSGGAQTRYMAWDMLYGLTSLGNCVSVSTATRLRYLMPWIETTAGLTCNRFSYNGETYARCW